MSITFVGSAVGVDTVVLPAHQAGDLIVLFAYNDSVITIPATPAGYTNAPNSRGGGQSNSHVVCYKIATSNAESAPVFSPATQTVCAVYRGVDQANPVGAGASFTNIADVTYPTITLQTTDRSWVVGAHGRRTGNQENVSTPPGTVQRADTGQSGAGRAVLIDTNKVVSSWPATASGGNNTFRYRSNSIELRGAEAPVVEKRTGRLNVTLAAATLAAKARSKIKGRLAVTLAPSTMDGRGKAPVEARATVTLEPSTMLARGRVLSKARLAVTLAAATLVARAGPVNAGRLNVTLQPSTIEARGRVPVKARLAATLLPSTMYGRGSSKDPEAGGTLLVTLQPSTIEARARIAVKARAAVELQPSVVEARGRVHIVGTLAVMLAAATLSARASANDRTDIRPDRLVRPAGTVRDVRPALQPRDVRAL